VKVVEDSIVTIVPLEGERSQMDDLQRVIEEAPTFINRVTGALPGPADAQSTYTILPEGKTYDDKFVFGVYRGGQMVGCVDLIRGFPNPTTAQFGLYLVSEKCRRQRIGSDAYALLEDFIRNWGTCDRIRIGIVRVNDEVIPFWTHLGFSPTGEVKPYKYGNVTSEAILYEKRLPNIGPYGRAHV
jgi:GNAT superfamily N-acetyltransferase